MHVDALIVGGGIAGLWLANVLQQKGYRLLLLERDRLGGTQTLASQGLIHGGLKYALSGQLGTAWRAITAMPDRWRACFAGTEYPHLDPAIIASPAYYMYSHGKLLDRLTALFASRSLAGKVDKLEPADYPDAFRSGFRGTLFRLSDFVVDVPGLIGELSAGVSTLCYRSDFTDWSIDRQHGRVDAHCGNVHVRATQLLLTGGAGNEALLTACGLSKPRMQRRPLKQVIVHHLHRRALFAHCLTGIRTPEPRLTLSTHADGGVLYIGGRLATTGVERTDAEQIRRARSELRACVPWLDWDRAEFSCVEVDRAEPAQPDRTRPEAAFVQKNGPVLTCWPTKLTLTPDLGDRVMDLLETPKPERAPAIDDSAALHALPLPRCPIGTPAWSPP